MQLCRPALCTQNRAPVVHHHPPWLHCFLTVKYRLARIGLLLLLVKPRLVGDEQHGRKTSEQANDRSIDRPKECAFRLSTAAKVYECDRYATLLFCPLFGVLCVLWMNGWALLCSNKIEKAERERRVSERKNGANCGGCSKGAPKDKWP